MRKIYLCGAHWCSPCQFVKNNMLKDIEKECAGQTEYIDIQQTPGAIDKYKVYRIPMMCAMDGDEIVERFSGAYPSKHVLIDWLEGKNNDFSGELHRLC